MVALADPEGVQVFADVGIEVTAVLIFLFLLIPSIVLLLCILEEFPSVSTGKYTFEDYPFFFGQSSFADICGPAFASLCCFFALIVIMFGFAGFSSVWYMSWRGDVGAMGSEATLGDVNAGWAGLVQTSAHGLSHFGKVAPQLHAAAATAAAAMVQHAAAGRAQAETPPSAAAPAVARSPPAVRGATESVQPKGKPVLFQMPSDMKNVPSAKREQRAVTLAAGQPTRRTMARRKAT
eukprot:gnl/TRDRNA2_/TRDRNA2_181444_c0_seq1.p1 gnl/TRDRNA2_/TRDRNA2_181444_c0~~gnl/TRDRNA2_/TRDRNA2_181444_c0_seq1.p1  ORF type:complete len:236 (-),score=54.48 gnl/TRDRNA2_/TRDRNA2_181444_c0_seq1:83-790(-)